MLVCGAAVPPVLLPVPTTAERGRRGVERARRVVVGMMSGHHGPHCTPSTKVARGDLQVDAASHVKPLWRADDGGLVEGSHWQR
jgi:hypothetical protein